MNNYINLLSTFFNNFSNELINKNIINEINHNQINIDYYSNSRQGDLASNFYLIIRKKIIDKNFNFEKSLNEKIQSLEFIDRFIISKNGFINLFLKKDFVFKSLDDLFNKKINNDILFGDNKKINIEFVSANPTGPIHIAHIRGAVFGDTLSKLYERSGFNITREYYVNDAGSQIEKLSQSLYKRYLELHGNKIDLNDDEYPGEYLIDIAKEIHSKDNDKWLKEDPLITLNNFKKFAVEKILSGIKSDLKLLDIKFDIFKHETEIEKNKIIDDLFKILNQKKLLFNGVLPKPKSDDIEWEPRRQLLFKSSALSDDQDRAFQKSNGEWTYFANDSAYHLDKYKRKYDKLINIWGSDHIGYIERMKSMVTALSNKKNYLDIIICQIVSLIQNRKKIKMSKREGNFVTLREVYSKVGKDPIRYYMISTRNETAIDFDLDEVVQKNKDNNVFYCQYAFARASSVINKAKDLNIETTTIEKYSDFDENISDDELILIKQLISYPYLLHQSTINNEPHRLINYLEIICAEFHSIWNKGKDNESLRFIDQNNLIHTKTKLFWIQTFRIILGDIFDIIGISSPEKM